MKNTTKKQDNSLPLTEKGVAAFLSGKWVEGIGPAYASKLVDTFGTDALRVLTEEPAKAMVVAGLGEARIKTASDSIKKITYPINLFAFLLSCGLSDIYIDRIFSKYKSKTQNVILSDPYSMVENVWQLSFFTADKIGHALSIKDDDPRRLSGAIVTAVKRMSENGHLFSTREDVVKIASGFTGVDPKLIDECIDTTVADGRIISSKGGLYLPVFYNAEKESADKLLLMMQQKVETVTPDQVPETDKSDHHYTPQQKEAILQALNSPVIVLTGGPGTGKTTVLRGIIELLEAQEKKYILAAPTGRAAKRMTMLTDRQASTIHRLLGYIQGQGYSHKKIDADVLIIDEGSMMEQVLFNHLLKSLKPESKVILVGDKDQLPAIGAGDVLSDMIASGAIPVANLDENFRQAEGSGIASGAKAINKGEIPEPGINDDFLIIEEPSVKDIHQRIMKLMAEELPQKYNIKSSDVVVVTPQQIGALGARKLNVDLQQRINPEGPELRRGATIFRLGDPVMQTSNSPSRKVYNGETGRITNIDTENLTLEVTFNDGNKSIYQRSELNELVLAYATTVHKLQGSEVKYMIFPVTMAHKPMLYRNLLYTAVSRASGLCVLVGEAEALHYAVGNTPASSRNSNFKYRLAQKR